MRFSYYLLSGVYPRPAVPIVTADVRGERTFGTPWNERLTDLSTVRDEGHMESMGGFRHDLPLQCIVRSRLANPLFDQSDPPGQPKDMGIDRQNRTSHREA